MKKTLLLAMTLLTVAFSACAQDKADASKVKHLTYYEFIKKVWNFEANPNTFEYKGKLPAIIDFYADWCGPCRKQIPVLAEVERLVPGVRIGKVNVDDNPELAARFGVNTIPYLAVFRDGDKIRDFVGVQSAETLRAALADV